MRLAVMLPLTFWAGLFISKSLSNRSTSITEMNSMITFENGLWQYFALVSALSVGLIMISVSNQKKCLFASLAIIIHYIATRYFVAGLSFI